jgi:predicted MFS family arabinose efflux permease
LQINERMSETQTPQALEAVSGSSRPTRYAYYALALLTLSQFFSYVDRYAFTLLLEPIKRDLGATDTQMSLLSGFAFVVFYTAFGIPIARWIDVGNRTSILSLCLAGWSVMTAACGFAASFFQMAVARALLAVGESGGTPAALSLIPDLFPKERRAQAIGILQSGPALTAIIGTPIVGIVAEAYSWREAFYVIAAPGVLAALLMKLTMKEPVRGAFDLKPETEKVSSIWQAFAIMAKSKAFVLVFVAQAIVTIGYGVIGAWAGAYLVRVHHVDLATLGAIVGPIYGPFMILGSIGGGVLASWLIRRTKNDQWIVLLPAICGILAVPALLGMLLAPSLPILLACGALQNMFLLARNAPVLTLSLDLMPPSVRAMTGGVMVLASSVIGMGLGPLLGGVLSDAFAPALGEAEGLRWALIVSCPTLVLLGSLIGIAPLRFVPKRAEGAA